MAHSHSPAPSNYCDCVASLRTSLSLLESSVDTLGAGVSDFPRLGSVLKTVRVRKRREKKKKKDKHTTNDKKDHQRGRGMY